MAEGLDSFFKRIDSGEIPDLDEIMKVVNGFGAGLTAGIEANSASDLTLPEGMTSEEGRVDQLQVQSFTLGAAAMLIGKRKGAHNV